MFRAGGGLWFVYDNVDALKERGIYEACLVDAFVGAKVNNRHLFRALEYMLTRANRAKLLEAGGPLPGPGPFTLYRGVSGRGAARRVRGWSWTSSLPVACWFSVRFPGAKPAVFTRTVDADEVLFYTNARNEEEYVILPPPKASRVPLTPEQLAAHAVQYQRIIFASNTDAVL